MCLDKNTWNKKITVFLFGEVGDTGFFLYVCVCVRWVEGILVTLTMKMPPGA